MENESLEDKGRVLKYFDCSFSCLQIRACSRCSFHFGKKWWHVVLRFWWSKESGVYTVTFCDLTLGGGVEGESNSGLLPPLMIWNLETIHAIQLWFSGPKRTIIFTHACGFTVLFGTATSIYLWPPFRWNSGLSPFGWDPMLLLPYRTEWVVPPWNYIAPENWCLVPMILSFKRWQFGISGAKLLLVFRLPGIHPPQSLTTAGTWKCINWWFPKPESHGIQGLNFQVNQPLNFRDDPVSLHLIFPAPFLWSPHLQVSALQELARSFSGGSNSSCHLAIAGWGGKNGVA